MSRYLTAKEKVALLTDATLKDVDVLRDRVTDGVVSMEGDRVTVRTDLRAYLRRRLEEEGLSVYRVSRLLGKNSSHLYAYFSGRVTLPLHNIEELLWLLDPCNCVAEDDAPTD